MLWVEVYYRWQGLGIRIIFGLLFNLDRILWRQRHHIEIIVQLPTATTANTVRSVLLIFFPARFSIVFCGRLFVGRPFSPLCVYLVNLFVTVLPLTVNE
jgi:hypothetical protein